MSKGTTIFLVVLGPALAVCLPSATAHANESWRASLLSGIHSSFYGQSLALPHRLKPRLAASLEFPSSHPVQLGLEAFLLPDASSNYRHGGGLFQVTVPFMHDSWGRFYGTLGTGIGSGAAILRKSLRESSGWIPLYRLGSGVDWFLTSAFGIRFRALWEAPGAMTLDTGILWTF